MSGRLNPEIPCSVCGAPLAPQIKGIQVKCANCGKSHTSIIPPPPPEDEIDTPDRGDAVAVKWGERWWPARLIERLDADRFLVHYDGWGPTFDEEVEGARLRRLCANDDDGSASFAVKGRRWSHPPGKKRLVRGIAVSVAVALLLITGYIAGVMMFDFRAKFDSKETSPALSTMVGGRSAMKSSRPIVDDDHLVPGEQVFIRKNERWVSAELISIRPNGTVKVRVGDPGETVDEIHPIAHIRILK